MEIQARSWQLVEPSSPLQLHEFTLPEPDTGEALIEIAGCGLCHTDVGFLFEGVRTRQPPPLTLGHEIAGTVLAAGNQAVMESGRVPEPGQKVVVPAVLPCGECPRCQEGRANICPHQKMPGNDFDGGFATHMRVPARFLVPVTELSGGLSLRHLAVVADAVTTPYQALIRAGVSEASRVVIVGAGGIGIYGVQIAAALGASVLAVDIAKKRVEEAEEHGAAAGVCTADLSPGDARKAVREAAGKLGWTRDAWTVLEMSGSTGGQQLAFSLLSSAGKLGIVGYTPRKVEVRLSNLMAFDADAFGSWGCSPEHYPEVLDLIADGKVRIEPFVSFHHLDEVNELLARAHRGELHKRAVLVPGEESA